MRRTCAPLFRPVSPLIGAAMAALLAGCASVGTAPPPVTTATAAAATPPANPAVPLYPAPSTATAPAPSASGAIAAAPVARPLAGPAAAGTPPPFAEVIRGAKSSEGFFTIWTRDEKTWIEIPANRLEQPFFFGFSLASGLGELAFWPGLMGPGHVAVLRRVGNSVQLVSRNQGVRAPAGTPLARALAESYSDSLLSAVALAAAPHPDRKSLLVEAHALLGGDFAGDQTRLESAYRLPYSLDRANSSIERWRTDPQGLSVTVRSHFAVARMPAPPVFSPTAPPPNPAALPNPPRVVPEPRSLFLAYSYTLAPLPEVPMHARAADQRVGFFTNAYTDFGRDDNSDRRTHMIRRWRLEKKDPAAAVSEPKQPIRVVMDRNIPDKWRGPVREGIVEWNKAFEAAGFRNAIVVEQQADDADWSSLEGTRFLAVRWFAIEGPGATAVGPSQSDPRTGELLRGAAIIPENWVRFFRSQAGDTRPRLPPVAAFATGHEHELCTYANDAMEENAIGFELLQLRGELDASGPEAQRFIEQSLKDVTLHEVGHALGLRHNFKASTGVTRAQLRDPTFTARRGVSNSVMDYNALNTPLEGEAVGNYHMTTLGAYDYWAIEYGYREFPVDDEKAELAKLAARAEREPELSYATDEDLFAADPSVNQRDLGDDPLAHAQRQMTLARELWTRSQSRTLPAADDMTVNRRNLQRGLSSVGAAVGVVAKHIGGSYGSRALAGAQQPLVTPVPLATQRAALDVLVNSVFTSASFKFDPRFMQRLGVDHLDRPGSARFTSSPDFSLPEAVLTIQRTALDALMNESLAARLASAETKTDDQKTLLSYADVQARLSDAAWSELKAGKLEKGQAREIDSLRRNLQREHLRRLTGGLLRPTPAAAADVRSVNRQVALQLEGQLKAALAASGWTSIAQAHLADSLATLSDALRAPFMRAS